MIPKSGLGEAEPGGRGGRLPGGSGEKADLFRITNLSCAGCVRRAEGVLGELPGVLEARVNLAGGQAVVTYDPGQISPGALREAVARAGFETAEIDQGTDRGEAAEERHYREARRRMLAAWAFTLPIIIWMLPEMLFQYAPFGHMAMHIGMIVLSAPVLLWPGWNTFKGSWQALRNRFANMDVLIAMGTLVAFCTGPLHFFLPVANYAGISAMIMAFHLTGRYLEARAKGRASEAIRKLLELRRRRPIFWWKAKRSVPRPGPGGAVDDRAPGEKIPTDEWWCRKQQRRRIHGYRGVPPVAKGPGTR